MKIRMNRVDFSHTEKMTEKEAGGMEGTHGNTERNVNVSLSLCTRCAHFVVP